MEDKALIDKIIILETKITILENKIDNFEKKGKEHLEDNSIISLVLDVFNFKKFLKLIFKNQNIITITDKFIDSLLLFLFLLIIFYGTGTLGFEWSPTTYTLLAIFFIAILELIGANTSIFKRFFGGDAKTKYFLKKINSMSVNQIRDGIKLQNFSSECLGYFIKSLEDNNKYPPEVVYIVLDSQFLRKENLDLLFKPNILKNIHAQFIKKLLIKKTNLLTEENIENIYSIFKNDESVIKILIATQYYSDCLSKFDPNNAKLTEYLTKYQSNSEHLDWILKIIPIFKLELIRKNLFMLLYLIFLIGFMVVYESTETPPIQFQDFFVLLFAPLIPTTFINLIIVPIFLKVQDFYYNHFINNVVEKT